MSVFINQTAIYNQSSFYCNTGQMPSRAHKASKHLIKLLSAYSNNNSLHKLENKFCMLGEQASPSLKDITIFLTSCKSVPPLGFNMNSTIDFIDEE